ncbi:MAG: eukaryotic-like serine/threonine-protein kinase, partial [Blastocatellia bacterium]
DHFTESNGQFLVMEYIAGNDLMTMLEKRGGPFDADQVVEWGDQLLGALAYLHSQHPPIIHRDIKPQNLKMTDQGQIILLDFGLAKGLPEQTLQFAAGQSIYGYTPDYAPLEQIKAEGTEARSDLYALSATLHHLLTNVTPPSALTRAIAVANQQPDPLRPANEINPQVKPGVAQVLMQALALMREQRPASADVMRKLLSDGNRASAPANITPTIVAQPPSSQGPTAPINPQPSQPVAPRPTQPGSSYPPPPSPSWPNAQSPGQQSWPPPQPQANWPPPQQPSSWPPAPPQPSWPNAQPAPQPGWPNAQPPGQQSWPNAQPQWGGPPPSYAPQARKSRTGLWIVLGLVAFVILGVVGLAIIGYMADDSSSSTSVTKNSTENHPPKTETYPPNANPNAANTTPSTNANSNTSSTEAPATENIVDKILARYVQALGGEEALKAVSSRVATGSFEVPSAGVSGTAEVYQKAPNKNLFIIRILGLATTRRGYNGSTGWEVDNEGNVKRLTGSELAAMKRGSGFYRELNLRNDYSNLTLSGKEKVDGKDAFIIDARAADGGEEKMYFDTQTGLLLRNDEARESGKGMTKTLFSDYRTVDGIKLPFTFQQEDGQTSAIIRIKEIRHNVTIKDSIFDVPSGK